MQPFALPAPRFLVVLGALALVLAGCDGSSTGPKQPVSITVTPSDTVPLVVGDSVALRATVQHGSTQAALYSTSNAKVATVSEAGLVRALGEGVATITVTAAEEPSARATVVAKVSASPAPALTVDALVDPANNVVDAGAVRGTIILRLGTTRGNARRLRVTLGETVACDTAFAAQPSSRRETIACAINTARFDAASGKPAFPNGTVSLHARLLGAADSVLAATDREGLVLANRDELVISVRTTKQAVDGEGLLWRGGDLTVTVVPVMYDPGVAIGRVQFHRGFPTGATIVQSDTVPPYEITYRSDTELPGVSRRDLRVIATSVTTTGALGPTTVTPDFAYDNAPPVPGSVAPREWIGAQTEFASTYDRAGEQDSGVGRVGVRFFAGVAGLTSAEVLAGRKEVRTGSDLREAGAGAYRVAALVCDALENCVPREGFTFGVDLQPPTLGEPGFPDRAVNPRRDLSFPQLRDNLSGIGGTPLQASVSALIPGFGAAGCGPEVEGRELPGRLVGACVPDTVAAPLFVPRSRAGYYTYTVAPLDRAGNRGASSQITVLVDPTPPSVSLGALPAALPAENAVNPTITLSAQASDNLDLTDVSFLLGFPLPGGGRLSLPLASAPFGTAFDEQLDVQPHAVSLSVPLVRTLTYGSGAGRVNVGVDSVLARATDAAELKAYASRALPLETRPGELFRSISGAAASLDVSQLCTLRCSAADLDSATVTVRITGESGSGAPFARMYLFRQHADGTVVQLGPPVTRFTQSEAANERTFTYQLGFRAPAAVEGTYDLFALGVSSLGNGFRTERVPVVFYRR